MTLQLATAMCLLALPAAAAETMRIAVGIDVGRAVVVGSGLAWTEDRDDAPATPLGASSVTVTAEGGRLQVNGRTMPVDALRLRAGSGPDAPISVNGTRVRGELVVLPSRGGVTVVNVLALEEYLVGVLGSEMPRSFPLEALEAQAVAARTYALNKKLEQYGQPYHLGCSVISQVYGGLDAEDPRTREAVEATRGLVLTWELQPIEAYFHASCGGHTESGAEALGRELPYLRSVECPCGALPTSHWTLSLSAKELAQLGGGKAATLEVQARSATHRAKRVLVGSRSLDAVGFRERVGYTRLRSLDFEVTRAADGVTLEGAGFGHGAGLCQWGARVLAERGWDFRKILAHYYPGAELQVLY